MAKFTFRLDVVLRLRETERQRRRQELAEALAADRLLEAELNRLTSETLTVKKLLAEASAPGALSIDKLLDLRRYELTLQAHQRIIEEKREKVAQEIVRRREALTQADRAVKILEKLKERRLREWQREETRRTFRAIDELANTRAAPPADAGFQAQSGEAPVVPDDLQRIE